MRVIDTDSAVPAIRFILERMEEVGSDSDWMQGYAMGLSAAIDAICEAHTIDAVPVTRCEHCLFRDTEHPDWCHAHMTLIQPNDFCSYGRPRNAQQ